MRAVGEVLLACHGFTEARPLALELHHFLTLLPWAPRHGAAPLPPSPCGPAP